MILCPPDDPFYECGKWQSFMPALFACIVATRGPVLEIGVGHVSTPVLHAFCITQDRLLISVEDDVEWSGKFRRQLENNRHVFLEGNIVEQTSLACRKYGPVVALVDNIQKEHDSNRTECFRVVYPICKWTVVHDFHSRIEAEILPLTHDCKSSIVTDCYFPPTLVTTKTFSDRLPLGLERLGRIIKSPA